MKHDIVISIIIVNYNVRDYLAHALASIEKALTEISHEIIIVDNHSVDGSVPFIKLHFPQIRLIENQENLGFGKANNQAMKIARGRYIVLINPDTVVQEDTFSKLLDFFSHTPEAAAATCKIINPDGSFSIDCRHSIPTPSIALWKVLGLSRLFPRSKIFGQYNMTYLDEDEVYTVPAISGSFMIIRREILDSVGFFDERFFMYCEDIDLCHRINLQGFKIYYVPTTQIIHYKGESTKKDRLDYVITFNKSLYKFFQKYYAPTSVFIFRWLVALGILVRGVFIYLKNFLSNHFPLVLDLIILNTVIIISFIIRLTLGRGFFWEDYFQEYWVINLIATILFLGIAFYLEIYPNHRFSIQSVVKANIITFILLAGLTFFLKQFGFSRMVVLITFVFSPLLMILWRAVLRRYYRGDRAALGKDLFSKPTAVIGSGSDVQVLFNKLSSRKGIDYDLKGWISVSELSDPDEQHNPRNLGPLTNLKEIIRLYRIRQIIFSAHSLSYEQILKLMSGIKSTAIEFKMVPSNLEVVIGKSHIEKLDDYPLLDIDYSLGRKFNRLLKRTIDISVSLPLFLVLWPFYIFSRFAMGRKYVSQSISSYENHKIRFYRLVDKNRTSTGEIWSKFQQILIGNLSLVGIPLQSPGFSAEEGSLFYKPGLTGLVQINRGKIGSQDEEERYHLFYLEKSVNPSGSGNNH